MALPRPGARRPPAHQEAEDSYFASMTDIMVGLLFIFVILLMYFAYQISDTSIATVPQAEFDRVVNERDQTRSERDEAQQMVKQQEEEISALKRELERYQAARLERYFTNAEMARAAMLRAIRERLRLDGIQVEIDETQGVLRLSAGVLFDSGSFDLPAVQSPRTKQTKQEEDTLLVLGALAAGLDDVLRCRSVHDGLRSARMNGTCPSDNVFVEAVLIEGHTDDVPIVASRRVPIQTNHDLSGLRASRTLAAIVAAGPQLANYRNPGGQPVIAASGYGPDRPIAQNDTDANRRRNRRIDVRVLMFTPRSVEELDEMEAQINARLAR